MPSGINGKLRDALLNGEIFAPLLEAKALIENWDGTPTPSEGHVTIDFAGSNLRFFDFVQTLLHVVNVKKWSQLAEEKVFVLYDKNSIYRISNVKDDKLFLDFSEFFHVDC